MSTTQVKSPEAVNLMEGLRSGEVEQRLRQYGYNEVPEKKINPVTRFLRKFWGITPWMLEITILLEWILGKYLEMFVVSGLLVFNVLLGFFQEEKANAALALLKTRLKANARVKRDGSWLIVPARELVPGDLVRVRAGDFVSADVEIVEGGAEVDQSSLTGESQLLTKKTTELLYGGSIVRRGEITGVVAATGSRTYLGRTMELVQVARPRLHMEEITSRVAKRLVAIVGALLSLALAYTALRGMNLLEVLPLAVVLMVAAIPVALPTMFTISMALGSMELMKKGILITRLSAIEDAATMTIVCADKTGTLTMNRLSFSEASVAGDYKENDVILYGALASREADQDPIDLAFLSAAKNRQIFLEGYLRKSFVPFDPSTRRTEATIEMAGQNILAIKGAVNAVLPLCRLSGTELAKAAEEVEKRSARGFRALAVAKGQTKDDIRLVGIAYLYDRPRDDSRSLLQELRDLGLQVKMLTGDALPIAREVAKELNLGNNIAKISDLKSDSGAYLKMVEASDGFAEIYPEDKYLVVKSLQKGGHVVGMTGDGVNDAPALRQAEVGIAVSSATDVAKKAASAILVTEGLGGIVDLIKSGRETYQRIITWTLNKIIKTFQITVFVILMFMLTGQYIVSALHMILLLFLTDFVTLSLATDHVRFSSRPDTWDITGLVKVAVSLGLLVIAELMIFVHAGPLYFGIQNLPQLQTFTFQALIFIELLDVLIIRERRHFWSSMPSKALLAALTLDLFVVFFISTMGFPGIEPIPLRAALVIVVFSLAAVFLVNDPVKVFLVGKFWGHEGGKIPMQNSRGMMLS
jgi:H+-transporting ATPase